MLIRLASCSYYLVAALLAAVIVANAGAAAQDYGSMYEHFSPSNRADTKLRSLLELLSLGLYQGATERHQAVEDILRSARTHERHASLASWGLLLLSAAFLALRLLVRRPSSAARVLTVHLLGVSLVFLAIGLLAPILSLVAYTEMAVLGQVVFRYESKGILTTVVELAQSRNFFIAAVLFTFSVVTPLVKALLTLLAVLSDNQRLRARFLAVVAAIGKWSMADVLVVAVLLAFFIAGADGFSDSWLGPGLYFFTGYCLLSLLAVQLLLRRAPSPAAAAAEPPP